MRSAQAGTHGQHPISPSPHLPISPNVIVIAIAVNFRVAENQGLEVSAASPAPPAPHATR